MTTTKTPPRQLVKLICPECQRQNEPERIYCHDCGARLDRSALAKVAPKIEPPEETRKRLKRIVDPTRARIRHLFLQVSKTVLAAAVVATVVEALLPAETPPRTQNGELLQIAMDIENAINSHSTAPIKYNETQVNAYLVSALKTKKDTLSKLLKFERATIKFDEGGCQVIAERSLFGYSLFTSASYKVSLQNGTLTVSSIGGRIGHLAIHPKLMEYGGILFGDLWNALDREKKLVSKMGSIEFHSQQVILLPRERV